MDRDGPDRGAARGASIDPTLPIVRRAVQGDVHDAVRLILSGARRASDEQILDFLSYALHRHIDLSQLWVVERDGRLVWAVLPVVNPGRTMLLLSPPRPPMHLLDTALRPLVRRLLAAYAQRDVRLAQVLIEPTERTAIDLYAACGFAELAELVYLDRQLTARHGIATTAPPPGMSWITYAPDTHALFARAIELSYEQSLDCPAMNGLRDIDDVVAGHKAAGPFDPSMWFVLREGDEPRGVVLLSCPPRGDAAELVYLGLTPAARGGGRGLADLAMAQALATAYRAGARRLTLAVDARNAPALKLYHRHGLRRLCSRAALIFDLRDLSGGRAAERAPAREARTSSTSGNIGDISTALSTRHPHDL